MKKWISDLRNAPKPFTSVAQNFGWMIASRGLAAVFSLIYLAIVTRTLGVSGFGKFALITGAAQLLANLLAFQTWQIIVQYGVNHVENGDETRLARLFRSAIFLDAISAVAGIAAAALILHFFADALGLKPTLARATLIFNIVMLISLRSTPLGILRLRDRFSLAAAADSATPTLRLIGAVGAWLIHPTLQAFLVAWMIAELLTAVAHWYAVHKVGDLRLMFRHGKGVRQVFDDNPGIVRYALATNFSQSLTMSAKQLPLFLVGGLAGTTSAGGFRLAAQLSRSLTTVSQLIARAAFPEIVRAVRVVGLVGLRTMIRRTMRVALVVSAVVLLLTTFFGKALLIAVGGPDFGQVHGALLWLTAAACIDLVVVAFEPAIMAAQRSQWVLVARIASTAMMVGATIVLVPDFAAAGGGAAVLLGNVVLALLLGLRLAVLVRKAPGADKAHQD